MKRLEIHQYAVNTQTQWNRPLLIAGACLALSLALLGTAAGQSAYVVNTSDDIDDGRCDVSHCSLREAINAANTDSALDTISFDVSAEISPLTRLPTITTAMTVNGWHGFHGQSRAVLDGSLCVPSPSEGRCDGLWVEGNKIKISGLVIKAFPDAGIRLNGDLNMVTGCLIGTDASASIAVPNGLCGIFVVSSSMNRIGSGIAGDGNVISGNAGPGVWIAGHTKSASTGTEVLGNLIGVAGDGVSPLPNGGRGVVLTGNVTDSRIGGTAVDERNVIAHNLYSGINLQQSYDGPPRRNSFRCNSIHSNGILGIDLGNNGPTVNDPGDTDDGANGFQNYPIITGVDPRMGSVSGQLDSTPHTTFTVDLFANTVCDPSGYGEIYLGSTSVETGANGIASFTISGLPLVPGQAITATATDPNGNTSELSPCLPPSQLF